MFKKLFKKYSDSLFSSFKSNKFLISYLFSLLVIILITGIGLLIRDKITPTNLIMPYLLGVVSIAVFGGRGPAVFASVLCVIAFDLFLVPPYLTFVVEDTEYIITFFSFFFVGVLISNLTAKLNDQIQKAKDKELRITALFQLSRDLTIAYSLQDVLSAIIKNIQSAVEREVMVFTPESDSKNTDIGRFSVFPMEKKEALDSYEAVEFTYRTGKPSGCETSDFPFLNCINLPLVTNSGIVGVLNISQPFQDNPKEQLHLFEAFANLSALAIERVYLNKQASQTQLLKAKEELQSALLNSISHDFRTPLVTIIGTLSSLTSESNFLNNNNRLSLAKYALGEAIKLNGLVSNLLNISRLESGALHLQLDPVDPQDLLGATVEIMKERLMDREVIIHVDDKLPLISADFVLLQQVLLNILDNALKYSEENTSIEINLYQKNNLVYCDIIDQGYGIANEEIPNIFKKFYQINKHTKVGGSGLGLAIVKGILDAHNAKINVFSGQKSGTVFQLIFSICEFNEQSDYSK